MPEARSWFSGLNATLGKEEVERNGGSSEGELRIHHPAPPQKKAEQILHEGEQRGFYCKELANGTAFISYLKCLLGIFYSPATRKEI